MKRNVLIQLKPNRSLKMNHEAQSSGVFEKMNKSTVPPIEGLEMDMEFPPVGLPKLVDLDFDTANFNDTSESTTLDYQAPSESYIVRGVVDEKKMEKFLSSAKAHKDVIEVYSDPSISTMAECRRTAIGDDQDVERLLNVAKLKECKLQGKGVMVAIVDTGINMRHLNAKQKFPRFDAHNSWKPSASVVVPGEASIDHGTMCAYDVCIAAPECTLLDIALLAPRTQSPDLQGYLSDAILAYRHLINVISKPKRIGENQSLVVNNSWGLYNLSSDFPVGHPGNYSDNPNHPFNRIVRTLERAGADILFAAGNCGEECPNSRCSGESNRTIYGANSSPYVTCVAGASVNKERLGYSSIGPGRLSNKKPDITGYTHFEGSDVYSYDSGTSAACPVVAGVVAAIRSKRPLDLSDSSTRPAAIRNLLTSSAKDLGVSGYDYRYGFGLVDTKLILEKLCPTRPTIPINDLCKRYPQLCDFNNICIRYPHICNKIPSIPWPPIPEPWPVPRPVPGPIPGPIPRPRPWQSLSGFDNESFSPQEFEKDNLPPKSDFHEGFQLGYLFALSGQNQSSDNHKHENCNCK